MKDNTKLIIVIICVIALISLHIYDVKKTQKEERIYFVKEGEGIINNSGNGQEFYFNESDDLNGSGIIKMSNNPERLLIWDDTPSNYLMINPNYTFNTNRTWDWEIKLHCNSTDKINFIIDYQDYELNYTLQTLCEELKQ